MLISSVLVLVMHYVHGINYPLLRSSRSGRVGCILHSALTIITLILPSSSLVLVTIIHYRAVFWAKFSYKLQIKHILRPVLFICLASLALAICWTTLYKNYSTWYCLPFAISISWSSIAVQSCISLICMASFALSVVCYCKIIVHLNREENVVQAMRSKKISNTKVFIVRFLCTFLSHLAQGVLLNAMIWLPMLGFSDQVVAIINVMYYFTVAITDVYLHAYVSILKKLFN